MWLAFLGVHLAGSVGYNLMVRHSMRLKADPWAIAAVLQTGLALPMLVVWAVASPSWAAYEARDIAQIVITAALVFALQVANVKALQYLEAGVFSVLYNVRIIVATVLGISVLGEAVVWSQIAGGLLIFIAAVVIRQDSERHVTMRGVRWGLAAAVIIAVLNMSEKDLIDRIGYIEYAIPGMILASVALWVVVWKRRTPLPLRTLAQPRMVTLMILRAASANGMLAAFALGGTLSVVTYVSSLTVVIIMALGVVLLGEKDYLGRKILSGVLALVGLTFILT